MKEHPMLMSAPMVRAILAGTKTQTRRVVKSFRHFVQPFGKEFDCIKDLDGLPSRLDIAPKDWDCCPYGQPGDRLWVREAWRAPIEFNAHAPRDIPPNTPLRYEATATFAFHRGKLRSSMFMPRWASRILLEIVSVRVERLQDISEADALAEGVSPDMGICWKSGDDTPRGMYGELWESINGPDSWDANPWVWVVEFKRVQP